MNRWQYLVHRISVWVRQHAVLERLENETPTFCFGVLTGMLVCLVRWL